MALPWLAVGKLVLNNLDTIIGVVKPGFTRKKVDTEPRITEPADCGTAAAASSSERSAACRAGQGTGGRTGQAATEPPAQRGRGRWSYAAVTVSVIAMLIWLALSSRNEAEVTRT